MHIDQTVKKSNRALGVLIRSFQKASPRGYLNVSSVLTSYCAYVRSNMEYCSVAWTGAAASHTDRLSRIAHKFLIWLNTHSRQRSQSLSYRDLLRHFKLVSVDARRKQHDLIFIRNVFRGRIRSPSPQGRIQGGGEGGGRPPPLGPRGAPLRMECRPKKFRLPPPPPGCDNLPPSGEKCALRVKSAAP